MRGSMMRMKWLWLTTGVLLAGGAGAAVIEDYSNGYVADGADGVTNGIYTVTGINLSDDANLLVVGAYVDNYADYSGVTFGGVAPDGVINADGSSNRNGQFYWFNPNTASNQTLSVPTGIDNNAMAYQLISFSGIDTNVAVDTTGSTTVSDFIAPLTTTANNKYIVAICAFNNSSDLVPQPPLDDGNGTFSERTHNGGGTVMAGVAMAPTAGTYTNEFVTASGWKPNPGISAMAFGDTGALPPLYLGDAAPSGTIVDGTPLITADFTHAAEAVDQSADVVVTINGTALTNVASVSVAGGVTTVSYIPTNTLSPNMGYTVQVAVQSDVTAAAYTNEASFFLDYPVLFTDITTNNTVMASAVDGPVGAGVPFSVSTSDLADGLWRYRTGFGISTNYLFEPTQDNYSDGLRTVFEAESTDNTPRLKTMVTAPEPGRYNVYAYFWGETGWNVRAGLRDLAGANSLALYSSDNTPELLLDEGSRELHRAFLGTVDVAETNGVVYVYMEDDPENTELRCWADGVGLQWTDELPSITYVDITAENTVMAPSSDGPVGTGVALDTSGGSGSDIWRLRTSFGIDSDTDVEPKQWYAYNSDDNVLESDGGNTPRLKTSAYVDEPGYYRVYAYFWNLGGNEDVRAGLEDLPGTDALALYDSGSASILWEDNNNRDLQRIYFGIVQISDTGTPIVVYTEDTPNTVPRTWIDGIGYMKLDSAPVTYVDATTNNTVMALAADGPVGAGTSLVTTNISAADGIWRLREGLGVPSSVTDVPGYGTIVNGGEGNLFESHDYQFADNVPRLKTSVSGLPVNSYEVYAYFWEDELNSGWGIRAGLEDTVGTNSLPWYTDSSSNAVQVAEDSSGRTLNRLYLGSFTGTSFDVYVEDLPGSNSNDRVWFDGVGYRGVTELTVSPEITYLTESGGDVTLVWDSQYVGTYRILRKTDLIFDSGWTEVASGIPGTAPSTTNTIPSSGASQEFYIIEGQ